MNWYKFSQRDITMQGLSPEDLFTFYTAGSLDDSTLAENHDVLDNFVIQVNQIRKYYLKFLIRQIADELSHALYTSEAYKYSGEEFANTFTLEDYIESFYSDDVEDEEDFEEKMSDEDLLESYHNYLSEYSDVTMDLSLTLEEHNNIKDFISKVENKVFLTAKDFQNAINIFIDGDWSESYGGHKWAIITEWTQKLYFSPEINLYQSVEIKIKQAKNVAFLLDTINSLEHNSNQVLVDLPHNEGRWMNPILDIVKHMKTPDALSYFTKNPKIMNVAVREAIFKQIPLQDKISHMTQILKQMNEINRKIFIRKISYRPVINVLLNVDADLIIEFAANVNVEDKDRAKVLSEFMRKHGAIYAVNYFYHSKPAPKSFIPNLDNYNYLLLNTVKGLPEAQKQEWHNAVQIHNQEVEKIKI